MKTAFCNDRERLLSQEAYLVYRACMYAPDFKKYKEKMEAFLSEPCVRVYLCEEDGETAGLLVLKRSGELPEILGIAVAEQRRGRGIGSDMIRQAMKAEGIARLSAQTDADAVGFYQKCGFSTEREEVRYPDGVSVRYRCFLDAAARKAGETGVIRKARLEDLSRIAEILVFVKRIKFRPIFQDDEYSFGELQVLRVAKQYGKAEILEKILVYDDGIVKGLIHIEDEEIAQLYVDYFFWRSGIGSALLEYVKEHFPVRFLWAIEKNTDAIRFYEAHGFHRTQEKKFEEGTDESLVKMEL